MFINKPTRKLLLRLLEKQKRFAFASFSSSSSSPQLLRNIGEFGAKKYFTYHQRANTTQLFVAIKGIFSGLFFFRRCRSKGKIPRDYLINLATCYLHIIKIYIKKFTKICLKPHDDTRKNSPGCNILIFYFAQIFVFCRLISKNVLKWFLLMMCEEHTLTRSTNPLSRNHPTLCFWLIREGQQMPNTWIYD